MIPATVTAIIEHPKHTLAQQIPQGPKSVQVPKIAKAEISKSVQPDMVLHPGHEKDKEQLAIVQPKPLPPVLVDMNPYSQPGVAKKQAPSRAEQGDRQMMSQRKPIEEQKTEKEPGRERRLDKPEEKGTKVDKDEVNTGRFCGMCNLF
jgi:hypothetical protein